MASERSKTTNISRPVVNTHCAEKWNGILYDSIHRNKDCKVVICYWIIAGWSVSFEIPFETVDPDPHQNASL